MNAIKKLVVRVAFLLLCCTASELVYSVPPMRENAVGRVRHVVYRCTDHLLRDNTALLNYGKAQSLRRVGRMHLASSTPNQGKNFIKRLTKSHVRLLGSQKHVGHTATIASVLPRKMWLATSSSQEDEYSKEKTDALTRLAHNPPETYEGGKALPVSRSNIETEALVGIVSKHYALRKPINITALKMGDNDHYLVNSLDHKYVLRVYRHNKHWLQKDSDYLFELDLLNFLREGKIPVSYPISRQDGDYIGTLLAPEGRRHWALFSVAEGELSELDESNCYKYGEVIARIHLLTNNFTSKYKRDNVDQEFLLDIPIEKITRALMGNRKDEMRYLTHLANIAKANIEKFSQKICKDEYGIIGGDFHGGNHFCQPNGEITLFDFDLCGYGWRAYDLAVFKWQLWDPSGKDDESKKKHTLWEAFLKGYESCRKLSNDELKIIPTFMLTRQIWLMGSHTAYQDFVLDKKYWDEMFFELRHYAGAKTKQD